MSGHQVTTGVSGNRNGVTTLLAWLARGPDSRSTTTSLAPASRPTRSWASRRESLASRSPGITTMTRHGCSRLAAFAASIESSSSASVSGAMTSVSTRPSVIAPPSSRSSTIFLLMTSVLLSGRSTIMARLLLAALLARASLRCSLVVAFGDHGSAPSRCAPRSCLAAMLTRRRLRGSRPSPFAARPVQHLEGGRRTPGAGLVLVWLAVGGPIVQRGIQYLPGQFDLLVDREERGFAKQYVEDQPFVGLGRLLGERRTVGEVHADVADLHGVARHLRSKPQRDALVGLHPDHQRILAELLCHGGVERQVRCPLEYQGDLGHPAAQPLSGAKVERHPSPPAGIDVQGDRRERLGGGGLREALLVEQPHDLLAALPARSILTAGAGLVEWLGELGGRQHLDLFGLQLGGMKADGLLHRGERQQLDEVVLDDVAGGADTVVVSAATTESDVLGHGDLDVVDVVGVPDRLEHLVGEAKRQHVLHRFLAKVVVDAEHRRLGEHAVHQMVERFGAGKVVAERLLDDHPAPAAVGFRGQPR